MAEYDANLKKREKALEEREPLLQALHEKMKKHRALALQEEAESNRLTKMLDHLEKYDVLVLLAKIRIAEEKMKESGMPVKARDPVISASSDIEEDTGNHNDAEEEGNDNDDISESEGGDLDDLDDLDDIL